MNKKQILIYSTKSNKKPFVEWLNTLDRKSKERVMLRIDRLESSFFGDFKSVGDEVFELRFHFGSGYRVYYGLDGDTLILLLCGGNKSSQQRDIQKAKIYFNDYKENIK